MIIGIRSIVTSLILFYSFAFGWTELRCQGLSDQVVVRLKEQLGSGASRSTYTLSGTSHAELVVDRLATAGMEPELRFTAWNGPVKSYKDDPTIPLTARVGYFCRLMQRFLMTEKPEPTYRLLFFGYRELYDRLPELAAKDRVWDRKAGRPVSGVSSYKYLQDRLNRENAYRELTDSLAPLNYRVRIEGGMENLRILPMSQLSKTQRRRLPPEVKDKDLLPARVSIDFMLTRELREDRPQ